MDNKAQASDGHGDPADEDIELVCAKCELVFDSKRSLHTHTERFCGRLDALAPKQEMKDERRVIMSFEEVKRYLESQDAEDEDTGQVSLHDLRKGIQANEAEVRSLKAYLQKKHAEQKVEELRKLKAKEQQARAKKLKERGDIEELMQLELQQKEKELQAGLEREKIARELKKVKEVRLRQLQEEKARSLAMLEREKEALKRRERDAMDQIKSAEDRIMRRDLQLEEAREAIEKVPEEELAERSKQLRQQQLEMSKEHGEKVALFEAQKKQLCEEQKKLQTDSQPLKERRVSLSVDGAAANRAVESLATKDGLQEQEDRVHRLRRGADATPVEAETAAGDMTSALREQELNALSSEYPRKLPLAKDAEIMLEQWLKAEGEGGGGSLQALMGKYGGQQKPQQAPPPPQQPPAPAEDPRRGRPGAQPASPRQAAAAEAKAALPAPKPRPQLHLSLQQSLGGEQESPRIVEPERELRGARTGRVKRSSGVTFSPSRQQQQQQPPPLTRTPSNRRSLANRAPAERTAAAAGAVEGPSALSPPRASLPTGTGTGPPGDEKQRLLKDIEGLRQRCLQEGGSNSAALGRLKELEEQVRAAPPVGVGVARPPSSAYPPTPFTGAGTAFPTYAMPPELSGYGGFGGGMGPYADTPMYGQQPQHPQQQHALLQIYHQLMSMEAENARLQDELNGEGGEVDDDRYDDARHRHSRKGRAEQEDSSHGKKGMSTTEGLIKSLSRLPPGHKLHKMLEDHLEMIASMQLEVDKMQKEREVEAVKRALTKEKDRLTRQQHQEEWLEEQRRQTKITRHQRTQVIDETFSEGYTTLPYDPSAGFVVYWDFALGLPDRLPSGQEGRKARLIYGLYEGKKRHGDPKSTSWSNCRKLSSKLAAGLPPGTSCVFGLTAPNPQVPPNAGLHLVVEVRLTDEANKSSESGGWAFIPTFQAGGGGVTLNRGFHKLPLLTGTFSPAALELVAKGPPANAAQQAKRPQPTGSLLFLRVLGAEDTVQDVPLDDPAPVSDIYLTPRARSSAAPGREDKLESPRPILEKPTPTAAPPAPAAPLRVQIPPKAVATPPRVVPLPFARKVEVIPDPPTQMDPFPVTVKEQPTKPPAPANPPTTATNLFKMAFSRNTTPPPQPQPQPQAPPPQPQPTPTPSLPASAAAPTPPAESPMDTTALSTNTMSAERPRSTLQTSISGSSAPGGGTRRGSRRNSLERSSALASVTERLPSARSAAAAAGKRDNLAPEVLPPPREAEEYAASAEGDNSRMSSAMDDGKLFVENTVPGGGRGARRKPWEKGDGFNVYLDGARGLPDNVTITRATLRLLTARNEQVGQDAVDYCKLEQLRASPEFGVFAEFRGEALDPTCTVLVRVDTVCLRSKKLCCVGYALHNVFVEGADPSKQPSSSAATDFVLNQGAFQVPLHSGPPQTSSNLSVNSLSGVPRLPCATVLLRIQQAARSPDGSAVLSRNDTPPEQWQATGVFVPAPRYADGVYDTTRCAPSEAERAIYQRRATQGEHKKQLRAVVAEAFPGDPPPPDGNAQEWLVAKLGGKPGQLLDPTYLLTYQQDLGLKVAVDGLLNLPSPGMLQAPKLYKVVYLLSPPALYFHDPPLTDDTHVTREYDLESPITAPAFKDGFTQFRQVPYNAATVLLLEVRSIKQEKSGKSVVEPASDGYWSCVPVFREGRYLNNGDFQLPLYKGAVPQWVIGSEDGHRALQDELKKLKAACKVELSDGASVSVRVTDLGLGFEEARAFGGARASTASAPRSKDGSYIMAACEATGTNAFSFDPRAPSDKTVRQAVPKKGVEATEFFTQLNKEFAEATKIARYQTAA